MKNSEFSFSSPEQETEDLIQTFVTVNGPTVGVRLGEVCGLDGDGVEQFYWGKDDQSLTQIDICAQSYETIYGRNLRLYSCFY